MDYMKLMSSQEIERLARVEALSVETMDGILWQICLQLATEREAAEAHRAYCVEVMEEQRENTRKLIAANEAMESDRQKAITGLARLQSGFSLGCVSLMDPPPAPLSFEEFSQGRQPQADGIPRDADGKPIPLE